jgi:hypothetical protein
LIVSLGVMLKASLLPDEQSFPGQMLPLEVYMVVGSW